jgi:small subunit ribosomal protein S16
MQAAIHRPVSSVGSRAAAVRPFTAALPVAARPVRTSLTVENRVALRFQRFGRTKRPFYRLVAIDSRVRRDGRPLEYLGWYDPINKETNLNAPAIKKWLGHGALPSQTVGNLLKKAYVIQPDKIKVVVPKVEV